MAVVEEEQALKGYDGKTGEMNKQTKISRDNRLSIRIL